MSRGETSTPRLGRVCADAEAGDGLMIEWRSLTPGSHSGPRASDHLL